MKKAIFAFLFVTSAVISRSQTTSDDQQAISMLKTFYTAYMSVFSGTTDAHKFENSLSSLRDKYLTIKCKNQFKKLVEDTDGDPIIQGQDSEARWAKTLSIKRDVNTQNAYAVSYYYNELGEDQKYHKTTITIKLMLIKINGVFKVDKIL